MPRTTTTYYYVLSLLLHNDTGAWLPLDALYFYYVLLLHPATIHTTTATLRHWGMVATDTSYVLLLHTVWSRFHFSGVLQNTQSVTKASRDVGMTEMLCYVS